MATESRTPLILTSTNWTEILVDPTADGYVEMLIDVLQDKKIFWSTLGTTEIPTSLLPDNTARFDYNIFVKCLEASSSNPVKLAITRL
jgi:hypothetical protein